MVDSGSDVVTIRQSILDTLDLEILGKIHSKGVHGSKTTNLYKATLQIGTQQMEIEVSNQLPCIFILIQKYISNYSCKFKSFENFCI